MTNKQKYIKLFLSTFYLSAATFGGGYVIISLMKKKFVDQLNWITEQEMLDYAALAQSSPGAVAVNASLILGYKVGGILGMFLSLLGTILPPLIIISVISLFYTAFKENQIVQAVLLAMQAAVAAVLVDVIINLGKPIIKTKELFSIIIMIGVFICSFLLNIDTVLLIGVCALLGVLKIVFIKVVNKV